MSRQVLELIKAPDFSDGDPNHRPDTDVRIPVDPGPVLQTLALRWMMENPNYGEREKIKRKLYTFDKLPDGYTVYGRFRDNNPKHLDRYIYGHPNHRIFRSADQFFPHFCFLALHEDGKTCQCDSCDMGRKGVRKAPRAKTGDVRRKALSKARKVREMSPTLGPSISCYLRESVNIDWKIEERHNVDWRGENEMVEEALLLLSKQPSFVPRVGELVLWYDEIDGEIRQDPSSGHFCVFHPATRAFTSHPQWMGGIVTQTPIPEQPVSFEDIERETDKEHAVTSSGFRIEWYAGPDARGGHVSNRYTHRPMHHIRPLAFWKEYMAGIPYEDWHPTVENTLAAMATLSTISRYRLKIERPTTRIYSRGCFLGAESLYADDVVRVSLNPACGVNDVFRIRAVVMRFENIESSEGDSSQENNQSIYIELHGSAFSLDHRRSDTHQPVKSVDLPPVMRGYGPWFHVGHSSDIVTLDHSQILGRLYEKQAMELWSPRCRSTLLDMGCAGVLEAREDAKKRDCRTKPPEGFYVADSRAEALNLTTFNGINVGAPDAGPDPKLWRDFLAAMDDIAEEGEGQSLAEAKRGFAMMSRSTEDSEETQEEDIEEMELDERTEPVARAAWNKNKGHPLKELDGNESSGDELQGPPRRQIQPGMK
ncbi:hypothetical protein MMC07_005996 [Pseudocyphellaria aurata]|nr:hypothetical protein [Pseudocyphellaria aurata]